MNMHRTTLHRWRYAITGFALFAMSATTAQAEYRILGNLYQQTTATTVISPITATPCTATTLCHFVFERVPNDKSLRVTQVSCRIEVGGRDIDNMFVGSLRTNGKPHQLFMSLDVGEKKNGIYTLNTSTFQLIGGNEVPVIRMRLTGKGDVVGVCSIAGFVGDE